MRIALIHISQETNSFNLVSTTLDDYRAFGILEGPDMLEQLQGRGQVGGYLAAIEASGLPVETIPIVRGWAVAGGRITEEAFAFFQETIRKGLVAAGPLDGVALQLHGACSAEGVDDVDGEQATLCRKIVGPEVPIVLGLDHHANVTRKMVRSCTAIVGHRTQPHDPHDTGVIGTQLLLRIVQGEVAPVTAWRKIPLLSHQEQFLTAQPPMRTWFDHARAMEADPRVLQASCYPMQPWLDAAEAGWSAVVVTDRDAALAEQLAELAWSLREAFQERDAIFVDDAIRLADAEPRGIVVLSDTGDSVFGGAPGDSNVILEAVLRLEPKGRVLIPLISPSAVATLVAAGESRVVALPLGGEAATAFFAPLAVTGMVRKIGGGPVRLDLNEQAEVDAGRVVVFDVRRACVMITERRGIAGNVPAVYQALGIELIDYKMAVLKTASNFQYFAPVASRIIRVDTRGPSQSDLFTLPWARIPRPIYPLEPAADRLA